MGFWPDPAAGRLRVLHIVESLELGGMERMIATLARASAETGVQAGVMTTKRLGPVADELRAAGIPVFDAAVRTSPPDYLAFRGLARHIRGFAPDVVHTHNTAALLFGATGARLAGVRTVVHTEHGRVFPDRTLYMVAERLVATMVWRLVGVSDAMSRALIEHEHMPRARVLTIPNGVLPPVPATPDSVHAARASMGLAANARVIGVGARLVWEKGLDVLLRALPAVIRRVPETVLVIAGDGPEGPSLRALASELALGDRVRFLGVRSDLGTLINAFDVVTLPSLSEGLPMALLEAMAAERPIVASRIGAMPEALDGGGAGLLIPANDVGALAAALEELLANPERGRALGVAARRRFDERYTAAAMARAYAVTYRRGDDSAWEFGRTTP